MPRLSSDRPKPTPAQIAAARDGTIPDVLGDGLEVLFVGINPSLYSAAVGHHFARPGNRFWPTLECAGFTPRLYSCFEDQQLTQFGCGLTNLVERATARADELSSAELIAGMQQLEAKVNRHRPRCVAFLGITAYRTATGERKVGVGRQALKLHQADVWVLPNPSGLNAHYQLPDLCRLYAELRAAVSGESC